MFTKVKGHAKQADVDRGAVLLADKLGNDGADLLAVSGAAEHAIDEAIVWRAALQRAAAEESQRMVLAVLAARRLQLAHRDGSATADANVGEEIEVVHACQWKWRCRLTNLRVAATRGTALWLFPESKPSYY